MANNTNGPELSGEAQRLIEAARGFDDPTGEDRERVRTRWLASIAAGAGLSALGTAARAGGGVGWGMKAAGAIAALTVGGLAFYTLIPSPPPALDAPSEALTAPLPPAEPPEHAEPAALPVVLPHAEPPEHAEPAAPAAPAREGASAAPPVPLAATPSVSPPAPAVAPAPRASAVPARPAVKAPAPIAAVETATPEAAPAPSSQLSEELAVIAEVRRSVQGGQGASALALLTEYQARFAAPILSMEAAALRVDALCQAGQQAAARAAAAEFEKAWPASPLRRRVAAACR